ncbi:hypothetical protein T484DRAFT_1765085, partial [Baffinella frigidus]
NERCESNERHESHARGESHERNESHERCERHELLGRNARFVRTPGIAPLDPERHVDLEHSAWTLSSLNEPETGTCLPGNDVKRQTLLPVAMNIPAVNGAAACDRQGCQLHSLVPRSGRATNQSYEIRTGLLGNDTGGQPASPLATTIPAGNGDALCEGDGVPLHPCVPQTFGANKTENGECVPESDAGELPASTLSTIIPASNRFVSCEGDNGLLHPRVLEKSIANNQSNEIRTGILGNDTGGQPASPLATTIPADTGDALCEKDGIQPHPCIPRPAGANKSENCPRGVALLRAVAMQRAKCIAFAMGLEERLGAESRVRDLDPGVVRMVLERIMQD